MVLFGGACVVLFGGACVVLFGRGVHACVVLFGGHACFYCMRGFIWGVCMVLFGGACMVFPGGHAWFFQFFSDTMRYGQ